MKMNESKIEKLAATFKLKIRILPSTIFITSNIDEWYLDIYDNGRYFKLFHKNTRNNTDFYHAHDTYGTIEEAFTFISEHDNYKNKEIHKEDATLKVKKILDQMS